MTTTTAAAQQPRAPKGLFYFGEDVRSARPQRDNLPQEDRVILLLAELAEALDALADAHDAATTDDNVCGCDLCDDVGHVAFLLQWCESTISDSLLTPGPIKAQRAAKLHTAWPLSQATAAPVPVPAATPATSPIPAPKRHYWQPEV